MNTTPTGEKVADLAATCLEKAANVKTRVSLFETVSNIQRKTLALRVCDEGHAGFDCVCDKLKIFAGHVLLLFFGTILI